MNALQEEGKKQGLKENQSEHLSWKNSLPKLIRVIQQAGLGELTLLVEYETPINARVDAMLIGRDKHTKSPLALIIELKQWEGIDGRYTDSESMVKMTFDPFEVRSHPIQQTNTYKRHMSENHSHVARKMIAVKDCQ